MRQSVNFDDMRPLYEKLCSLKKKRDGEAHAGNVQANKKMYTNRMTHTPRDEPSSLP